MKVVYDTNIYVSALAIPGGQAERAIALALEGRVKVCISKPIVHEALRVLAQKLARAPEQLARTAIFLTDLGESVVPRTKLAVLSDEPDNRILECAVAGRADAIVTGDKALLALRAFEGIRILSLRQFLNEMDAAGG
ncbi:MAG: putative toxin-antitoxin system toxin component, PIN family [Gammaproteobacteria bacterium]|nr:putative toxin-antitoxin system toxin component, PIN family [Gammaproteobacteria bacterium]